VAIEWVKKDKLMPREAKPTFNWSPAGDIPRDYKEEEYWPANSESKSWYNYKYFRVLSELDSSKEL